MSLPQFADRLTEVAQTLRDHAARLDAASFISEADKFAKAFDKFHDALRKALASQSPEVQALTHVLALAFTGDEKGLKAFAKKHAQPKGVSFTVKDTVAQRHEKAATRIAAAGRMEVALAELRLREAPSMLDFSQEDDLALLQQVRRLGQIGEEARKIEGDKLLREPEKIRLLAKAAKLKFTPKSKPAALLKKLFETGLRYAENTGRE